MKKKSKYSQNSSLKNPAIIMGAIAIVMIILIVIFNIKSKVKNNKTQTNQVQQTNQVEASFFEIDKNSAYAKIIDKYFQALNEKDAEKLISLFPANENYTKENAENQLEQMYTIYETECGSNVEITYEFSKAAEAQGQTLEDLKNQIATAYKIESGVTKIYTFEIYLIRTGDISSARDTIYLNLAKINENWYIV